MSAEHKSVLFYYVMLDACFGDMFVIIIELDIVLDSVIGMLEDEGIDVATELTVMAMSPISPSTLRRAPTISTSSWSRVTIRFIYYRESNAPKITINL